MELVTSDWVYGVDYHMGEDYVDINILGMSIIRVLGNFTFFTLNPREYIFVLGTYTILGTY